MMLYRFLVLQSEESPSESALRILSARMPVECTLLWLRPSQIMSQDGVFFHLARLEASLILGGLFVERYYRLIRNLTKAYGGIGNRKGTGTST